MTLFQFSCVTIGANHIMPICDFKIISQLNAGPGLWQHQWCPQKIPGTREPAPTSWILTQTWRPVQVGNQPAIRRPSPQLTWLLLSTVLTGNSSSWQHLQCHPEYPVPMKSYILFCGESQPHLTQKTSWVSKPGHSASLQRDCGPSALPSQHTLLLGGS